MPMMEISDERFEELVDQALAQIPDEVHEHIKNVVFLIEDYNPRSPYILGQYTGPNALSTIRVFCPTRLRFTARP